MTINPAEQHAFIFYYHAYKTNMPIVHFYFDTAVLQVLHNLGKDTSNTKLLPKLSK